MFLLILVVFIKMAFIV